MCESVIIFGFNIHIIDLTVNSQKEKTKQFKRVKGVGCICFIGMSILNIIDFAILLLCHQVSHSS